MKPQNLMTVVVLLLVLAIAGVGYYMYGKQAPDTAETTEQTAEGEAATEDVTELSSRAPKTIEEMMSPRFIGSADAPLTIVEYSSLSCGHCASFHKSTLPTLKERYVDTGKVKFVFKEFPLNQTALHASMLLRCVAADKYVALQEAFFASQESWAYVPEYKDVLIQNAQLAGLSAEDAEKCLANEELATRITKDMQDQGRQWQISSTPTFVFNNGERTLNGDISIEGFSSAVDGAFAAATGMTPPAPTTDTLQPADAAPTAEAEVAPATGEATTEEPAKTE